MSFELKLHGLVNSSYKTHYYNKWIFKFKLNSILTFSSQAKLEPYTKIWVKFKFSNIFNK